PVLDTVQREYGLHARTLSNNDPRLIEVKCRIMTAFIKEIKETLNREREMRGQKPLQIAVHVHMTVDCCRFVGLDVKEWVDLHLVDKVVIYPLIHYEALPQSVITDTGTVDIDQYAKATVEGPECFKWGFYDLCRSYNGIRYDVNGENDRELDKWAEIFSSHPEVESYVIMMPRLLPQEEARDRAKNIYAHGLFGLSYWDANCHSTDRRLWTMYSRLGHKEELASYTVNDGVLYRNHNLITLGTHRLDRYAPHWGS
ncbi:MAG: hypothetical protein MJ078_06055, partial [Clostridia bacterium]|nr:hypothetical protein [Clostridia bacterium]